METNNSDTYNLKNIIKEPNCCKTPINLLASDFHRMTVMVMKATFEKFQPRAVNYRDYKYFENCRFRADLLSELSKENIEENEEGLSDFLVTFKRILDLHVPHKQKYARGNHMPFMNRALSKETMTRTILPNNFLKERNEETKGSIQNNAIIVYHY